MRFTIDVLATHPADYILLEKIFLTAGNRQSDTGSERKRQTDKGNILNQGSTHSPQSRLRHQSRLRLQAQLQQRLAPGSEITNVIEKELKRYRS